VTVETVEEYLRRYGWSFQKPQADLLITNFVNDEKGFLVVIQIADPWIRLSIPAYLSALDSAHERLVVEVLKQNLSTRMARFFLDENMQIGLCVDLYSPELRYADFELGLDTLTHFAGQTHSLLQELLLSGEEK
jgi:hypothetical protein